MGIEGMEVTIKGFQRQSCDVGTVMYLDWAKCMIKLYSAV